MDAAHFCFPGVACIVQWMHETPAACGNHPTKKKEEKNTDYQAVYYLNAWEFATLWEVKLLPASGEAIERLEARSARASGKPK